MVIRSLCIILLASSLFLSGSLFAQPSDIVRTGEGRPVSLQGRHSLTVGIGLLPEAKVEPGTVQAKGFFGSFAYTYWPLSEWGIELGVSLLDSEVTSGTTTSTTALLLGTSYYPEALAIGTALRPYLTGAVGPYVGVEASGEEASARVETVFGARVGGGIDAYVWRWIRVGVRGAYHAAPEYGEVGERGQSASGGQLSIEVGLAFGRR